MSLLTGLAAIIWIMGFIKHEFEKFTIPGGFDIIAISNKSR